MPGDNCADTSAILEELSAIKRLLILVLLKEGFSQADVGAAIGVDQSTVSRMFPRGVPKRRS
jgi:predicted transcriptional regulator